MYVINNAIEEKTVEKISWRKSTEREREPKDNQVIWALLITVWLAKITIVGTKLIKKANLIKVWCFGKIEKDFCEEKAPIIRKNKTDMEQVLNKVGREMSIENFTESNRNLRS